jgi:hypothetical protein
MLRLTTIAILTAWTSLSQAAPVSFSASGPDPAAIQGQVDAFRAALGGLNPNMPGSFGTGRREINWDGVPDNFSAPNNLPANFFNVNSPRGVIFSTPGSGFQVSADSSNPTSTPVEFGNIDPFYPSFFATFSPQRLFTALGSTVTDVNFFVPGTTMPAFTNAFGAVFTDVDAAGTTSIQFFDAINYSLGTFLVPPAIGDETLSFLGVRFDAGEQIGRVRITSGAQPLAFGNGAVEAMDDFIYAEPVAIALAVSEPASLTVLLLGLLLMTSFTSRRTGHAS